MLGDVLRFLAGGILSLMGLAMFAAATKGDSSGFVALASVLLPVVWVACGIAVLAGKPWGRLLGLILAVLGLALGVSLATGGTGSPFARVFFSAPDAARWYVVMPTGYACAILSAVTGLLLLPPFGPWVSHDDQPMPPDPSFANEEDASDR